MSTRACDGKNAKGRPCGAPPVAGSSPPRCWAHAKGPKAERDAAARRARGGRNRMIAVDRAKGEPAPLNLSNPTDAARALARVAEDVWAGKLDPRSANAIVGAVQAMLAHPELLPAPPDPFAEFAEVRIERNRDDEDAEDRIIGVRPDGSQVVFSPAQVQAWRKHLRHVSDDEHEVSLEWVGGANVPAEASVELRVERARAPEGNPSPASNQAKH